MNGKHLDVLRTKVKNVKQEDHQPENFSTKVNFTLEGLSASPETNSNAPTVIGYISDRDFKVMRMEILGGNHVISHSVTNRVRITSKTDSTRIAS